MRNKKILRNITIIISIIVVLIDIALYIKLRNSLDTFSNLENSIERAGGLIGILMYFGTFVWGIISLIILWIQYFLTILTIKVFNKLVGIKKWLLSSLLAVIVLVLIIIELRILVIMSLMLFK